MVSGAHANRPVAISISAGLGVVLPAAAFAATLPLDRAHEVVSAAAAPFAVGAVAGVGVLALSLYVSEWRTSSSSSSKKKQVGGAAAEMEEAARQDRHTEHKGVPVIARAEGALSDDEVWADFDAMLAEDSSISCDPARSKDIYQIALEELQRNRDATDEAAAADAPAPADASCVEEPAAGASPDSTDVYLALAAGLGSRDVDEASTASEDAARTAAMASLSSEVEYLESTDTASAVQMPASDSAQDGASAAASTDRAQERDASAVPRHARPASGSDPEEVWARALAILAEEAPRDEAEDSHPVGAHFARSQAASEDAFGTAASMAVHFSGSAVAPRSQDPSQTSAYLEELVEDELNRMRAATPRRTGREHFRVVQGGTTASLPRLTAEA